MVFESIGLRKHRPDAGFSLLDAFQRQEQRTFWELSGKTLEGPGNTQKTAEKQANTERSFTERTLHFFFRN